ncbi:hypothetical protein [Methanofollis fontis]|uniref:Uncharacterized protein n=1 Tax=Methanofollis fontis TaxID=2052832 RepID=A0A483CVY9_9EURY|nr:hypothetical protein [Methanofollis fontis]TAJ45707.1 hypothetical protein CUJ86_03050 [Methanofollis fontis]
MTAFEHLPGADTAERFAGLGIRAGEGVSLLSLRGIADDHGVEVWIYFDPAIARTSSIEADLVDFEFVPEPDRPFMELRRFLLFMESIEPGFDATLGEHRAEIIAVGNREAYCGCVLSPRPYVKVLLRDER